MREKKGSTLMAASSNDFVTVEFSQVYTLKSTEIAFLNTAGDPVVFDCRACSNAGCCESNSRLDLNCFQCSCQNKGATQCQRTGFCNPTCNTFTGCSCANKETNPIVFLPQTTQKLTCDQALTMISSSLNKVFNINSVTTQCDLQKRLSCCKGDLANVTQQNCGPFWGPSVTGACDEIITNYCSIAPNDPLCACVTSEIPLPQCNDRRCANTNAMRTRATNVVCTGITLNCVQIFKLSNDARENLIQNVTQQLNCNLDVDKDVVVGSAQSTIGTSAIIGIIIGMDILIFLFVIAIIFTVTPKKAPVPKKVTSPKNVTRK